MTYYVHTLEDNIVDISILPKVMYKFTATPNRTPKPFQNKWKRKFLKYICNHKGPQRAKTILTAKNKDGGFTCPDFKIL